MSRFSNALRSKLPLVSGVVIVTSLLSSRSSAAANATAEATAKPGDYWSNQNPRFFAGGQVGLGIVSRAALSAGYGKPNDMWVGVEGGALLAPGFLAYTGQICLEFLLLNLDFGLRQTDSHSRRFPNLQPSYTGNDLWNPGNPQQRLTSFDAILYGFIPLGPTLGYWDISYERELNAPTGTAMYLEYLAVIAHEPEAWSGRYAWHWNLFEERLRVGPMFDFVATPNRKETLRLGVSLFGTISEHISGSFALSAPVSSPDELGLNGWWGLGRITWSWATGEPKPGFF